jgi:hypothetical protein
VNDAGNTLGLFLFLGLAGWLACGVVSAAEATACGLLGLSWC